MNDEELIVIDGSECPTVKAESKKTNSNKENIAEEEDDFFDNFSDEVLEEDPDKKAKTKLQAVIAYLKSSRFVKKINSVAYKKGIPPKQVAKGVIGKAFGIVGDILGIAVNTISSTLNGLIDLLHSVLKKGVEIITRVVSGICSIVTFNQTVCNF